MTAPLTAAVKSVRAHIAPLDNECSILAALVINDPESAALERCSVRLTGHANAITAAARQIRQLLAERAKESAL